MYKFGAHNIITISEGEKISKSFRRTINDLLRRILKLDALYNLRLYVGKSEHNVKHNMRFHPNRNGRL